MITASFSLAEVVATATAVANAGGTRTGAIADGAVGVGVVDGAADAVGAGGSRVSWVLQCTRTTFPSKPFR